MRNKIGNEEKDIIYLKEKIGSGSFGTIYKCSNNHNEELAVKMIKCKNGLPCLFEASIMSMTNVIQHPYLNNTIKIHSNLEKLFIVQDLAISDLRKFRYYNNCDYTLMVDWIYSICQGIKYLHSKDIIHGDIKPNNILVYSDHTVKITDFNMSTKRTWNKKYQPCTNNYRPVEGWLNSFNSLGSFSSFETSWDLPLDIWSLGCTIYYIKYGKSLFVSQDKDASINAIVEWSEYIGDKTNISKRRRFYYSPRIDMNFNNDNCQINELIKSILRIDPNNRPYIDDILHNKIFTSCDNRTDISNNSFSSKEEINKTEESIFMQITKKRIFVDIKKYTEDKEIIELTYELYMKSRDLIYINDDARLIACLWIIHKIITRSTLPLSCIKINYDYLLKIEKIVCEYLSYNIISL